MIHGTTLEANSLPRFRVLVVDDEPIVTEGIERYLSREGFDVETAHDGEEALRIARTWSPDIVLLDLMLPGIDGLEVCRTLHKEGDPSIIMLTARGEETDRIVGLEVGADDYVVKPFSLRELGARIKAVLRRTTRDKGATGASDLLRFSGLQINPRTREVEANGRTVQLSAREFDLLYFLAANAGQVFTREQLMDRVWDYTFAGDTSTITVHVRRIREKIEADPMRPRYIKTVWGVGYKFER